MTTPTGVNLSTLIAQYLREADSVTLDAQGDAVYNFTTPLTAPEQAILADLRTMAGFGIPASITLAEFQAIKPDLVTARNFVGIASPTAAQSNAALKATIRVLGALLRS